MNRPSFAYKDHLRHPRKYPAMRWISNLDLRFFFPDIEKYEMRASYRVRWDLLRVFSDYVKSIYPSILPLDVAKPGVLMSFWTKETLHMVYRFYRRCGTATIYICPSTHTSSLSKSRLLSIYTFIFVSSYLILCIQGFLDYNHCIHVRNCSFICTIDLVSCHELIFAAEKVVIECSENNSMQIELILSRTVKIKLFFRRIAVL